MTQLYGEPALNKKQFLRIMRKPQVLPTVSKGTIQAGESKEQKKHQGLVRIGLNKFCWLEDVVIKPKKREMKA